MKISWRISRKHYLEDKAFSNLLNIFLKNKDKVDEVVLLLFYDHGTEIPNDILEIDSIAIKKRICEFKQTGFEKVGINVICTIGQTDHGGSFRPKLSFQGLVDSNGINSNHCACPHSKEFEEYTNKIYTMMAKTNPDFIWIDDDLRMQAHMPVDYSCFCEISRRKFADKFGTYYEFDELVEKLNHKDENKLREQWVLFNEDSIADLFSTIKESINKVNPKIKKGFMTGLVFHSTYSGEDYEKWFSALDGEMIRPGGGFVNESKMFELYNKITGISCQLALTPSYIKDIQYESENIPYNSLGKSVTVHQTEGTIMLTIGNNGIMYNIAMLQDDFLEYERLFKGIDEIKAAWDEITKISEETALVGLNPFFHNKIAANQVLNNDEKWLGNDSTQDILLAYEPLKIGIPLTQYKNNSYGTILTGRIAQTASDKELEEILSGAVLMDGETVLELEKRNMGHLVGVKHKASYDNGVYERLTSSDINGKFKGFIRDAIIDCTSVWFDVKIGACCFDIIDKNAIPISDLENLYGEKIGVCAALYENKLGGRVAVMGYAPWIYLGYECKLTQMRNVIDWVTKNKVPIKVLGDNLSVFIRENYNKTKGMVTLLNNSIAPSENAKILLRSEENLQFEQILPYIDGLRVAKKQEGYEIDLPSIPAWQTLVFKFYKLHDDCIQRVKKQYERKEYIK